MKEEKDCGTTHTIGAEWLHRSNGGEDVSNTEGAPMGDEKR